MKTTATLDIYGIFDLRPQAYKFLVCGHRKIAAKYCYFPSKSYFFSMFFDFCNFTCIESLFGSPIFKFCAKITFNIKGELIEKIQKNYGKFEFVPLKTPG